MTESAGRPHVLILIENLSAPFDRRAWQEATTLHDAGFQVSIICPTGHGSETHFESLDGVDIYRYDLPLEASSAFGYLREYTTALANTLRLASKIWKKSRFDVIHACNPPDLFFLIAWVFKIRGRTKFVFDHHDINPELFEAKFSKRGPLWNLMVLVERLSFWTADISIATNESYREIAIRRGKMDPEKVFVVRSGPKLDRLKLLDPVPSLKNGKKYLVGYVGVIGEQEGLNYLVDSAHYIVHELKRTDIHFGVVGGGTSLEDIKKYAASMGVTDYFTFTGRVSDRELLEMLNTSDVCVNTDVANDMNDKSTMNKIMEYMALGKPIVQFDLTEGRFSAQDASLYAARNDPVDFAHNILKLVDDETLRSRMGAFGQERIRNHLEWKYEAPKLLGAYNALFGLANR